MLPHLITNIIYIGQFETILSFNQMGLILSWCFKTFNWYKLLLMEHFDFQELNHFNGQQCLNVAYQTHCTLFFVWPRTNIFLSMFWLVIWMSTNLELQNFEYFASRLKNYESIQNICILRIIWNEIIMNIDS